MTSSYSGDDMPSIDLLVGDVPASSPLQRLRAARVSHPAPLYAYLEMALWALILVSIVDHLHDPTGTTGSIVWVFTIGFHEVGHLICNPFGTLLMFLGGTIWQVLVWVLVGAWEWFGRRRVTSPLLLWALAGHSLLNAAVYIGDAQARSLPLLFGMNSSHHDWWNILSLTNLLDYDWLFALLTRILGVGIIVACALAGSYMAWVRPRTGVGKLSR
ncbi:MAG: hypothetical protein KC519_19975 [Anaerolineae bacterium]|nr:hypothetical protein [Anaerolineae bacterium]